jgi:hypothetical protein
MKYQPKTLGLFQAAGLILYVSIFAFAFQFFQQWADAKNFEPTSPLFPIIAFLLAFIISAIICSSIMFAYPVRLFFVGNRNAAFRTILWSLGWLLTFFIIFLIIFFLFINKF